MLTEKMLKRALKEITIEVTIPELQKSLYPDRSKRYTVDLATERTDISLGWSGVGIMVVNKGDGIWSMKIKHSDGSTTEFLSSEIGNSDRWEVKYNDILFTNTAQPVAQSPKFLIWWVSSAA